MEHDNRLFAGLIGLADTCVCMFLYGKSAYYDIAHSAVASLLEKTDFDIFLAVDQANAGSLKLQPSSRIHIKQMFGMVRVGHRSIPFLLKFQALKACLDLTKADQILLMDADTFLVANIGDKEIRDAIQGYDFGMVEQRTIKGSSMTRCDFLEHYRKHTLVWFDSHSKPPLLSDFRFYNSGVVLGRNSAFASLTDWAIKTISFRTENHQIGQHMIADQDYFQYWMNTLYPGCCKTLEWKWNHCPHWDDSFPNPQALVLHFSNFCRGPDRLHLLRIFCYKRLHIVKKLLFKDRGANLK